VPEAPTVGQLRAALDAVEPLVAGIPDGLWTAPTPCTDWDVRALVAHVVAGNRLIADVLAGLTTVEEFRAAAPADPLGDRAPPTARRGTPSSPRSPSPARWSGRSRSRSARCRVRWPSTCA